MKHPDQRSCKVFLNPRISYVHISEGYLRFNRKNGLQLSTEGKVVVSEKVLEIIISPQGEYVYLLPASLHPNRRLLNGVVLRAKSVRQPIPAVVGGGDRVPKNVNECFAR